MTDLPRPMPVRIETERLILRPFAEADLDRFADINADPEVMRYLGDGQPLDRKGTWHQMAVFLGHWQLRGYGMWAVEEKASGIFVGRVGLHNPEGWPGLEIGWTLDRNRWGHGYATEAARAALAQAFACLDVDRIISLIRPANAPSIRVARKLGGRYDRTIRLNDREAAVYAIDRSRRPGESA